MTYGGGSGVCLGSAVPSTICLNNSSVSRASMYFCSMINISCMPQGLSPAAPPLSVAPSSGFLAACAAALPEPGAVGLFATGRAGIGIE